VARFSCPRGFRDSLLESSPKHGWTEEFKKRLSADPATVLKENGIEMPEGWTVKVVELKDNEIRIPLPAKPTNFSGSVEEPQERMEARGRYFCDAGCSAGGRNCA
jgi:hypothetical protein